MRDLPEGYEHPNPKEIVKEDWLCYASSSSSWVPTSNAGSNANFPQYWGKPIKTTSVPEKLPEGFAHPNTNEMIKHDWLEWNSEMGFWGTTVRVDETADVSGLWGKPSHPSPPEGYAFVPLGDELLKTDMFWCSDEELVPIAGCNVGTTHSDWAEGYDNKTGPGFSYLRKIKVKKLTPTPPPEGYELVPWNVQVGPSHKMWEAFNLISEPHENSLGVLHSEWQGTYEAQQALGKTGGCFIRINQSLVPPEGWELVPWDELIRKEDKWWSTSGFLQEGASSSKGGKNENFRSNYEFQQRKGMPGGCYVREIKLTPFPDEVPLSISFPDGAPLTISVDACDHDWVQYLGVPFCKRCWLTKTEVQMEELRQRVEDLESALELMVSE